MSEFGKKCREAGLTAYRISKDTGVNVQNVQNWMKGSRRPVLSEELLTVIEYCNEHGAAVTVGDLIWSGNGNV